MENRRTRVRLEEQNQQLSDRLREAHGLNSQLQELVRQQTDWVEADKLILGELRSFVEMVGTVAAQARSEPSQELVPSTSQPP